MAAEWEPTDGQSDKIFSEFALRGLDPVQFEPFLKDRKGSWEIDFVKPQNLNNHEARVEALAAMEKVFPASRYGFTARRIDTVGVYRK